jgi:DNA repair protein RadA/Sms
LVEIQALMAPTTFGTPRRAVVGWDTGRLAMVLAVLEARCGIPFGGSDIYLNVAGGLRINEPAADLAVAAALLSCLSGKPLPADAVVFGEVSLSGAVRAAGQTEARLKEALKLGFKRAYLPASAKVKSEGLTLKGIENLGRLVAEFGLGEAPRRPQNVIG